jgi:AcrR family transcriptional regulator
VREEAKAVALGQLAEGGAAAISINAIGRELGVSGPALYRYFAGRDALLTALVVDAYADLTAAVLGAERPRGVAAFARRYRAWALAEPHRYRLLYAAPTPGYDAHRDELVAAAQTLMDALLTALDGEDAPAPTPSRRLAAELRAWAKARGIDAQPGVALRAVQAWIVVHGHVALEIEGNFASMGLDAGALFAAQVAVL